MYMYVYICIFFLWISLIESCYWTAEAAFSRKRSFGTSSERVIGGSNVVRLKCLGKMPRCQTTLQPVFWLKYFSNVWIIHRNRMIVRVTMFTWRGIGCDIGRLACIKKDSMVNGGCEAQMRKNINTYIFVYKNDSLPMRYKHLKYVTSEMWKIKETYRRLPTLYYWIVSRWHSNQNGRPACTQITDRT
jgi:hypothetical protein